MKTVLFLMFVSMMSVLTIGFGQSRIEGVKVGVNFAAINGVTNSLNNQSVTAYNAGVFATFEIAGLLALQPELLYTMKGFKLTKAIYSSGPTPIPNIFVTGNNSYFEIPVLLKLKVPSSSLGIIRPNVFAGPEVAFGLSSKLTVQSTDPSETQGNGNETNSKPTDFGIIIGAGADINLPGVTLIIDVRYDMGMKSLDFSQGPAQIKNRVLTINAGIGI
jgi:Outer membrane protein beta-barrel domain